MSVAVPPPAVSKPPCKIDPTAIISDKAVLVGTHPITIGSRTVLHPYAKLDSTNGPITLGSNCIISERANVEAQNDVKVDDHVSIETGALVQSSRIGQCCTISAYALLQTGTQLGQFCKITPKCTLPRGTVLPDFTVVLEKGHQRLDTTTSSRRDIQDLKIKGQAMHVDTLKRLIPSSIAKWA
ncbi:trimeric LpxA-like protein [Elsinoe ampelina]|uniref:Dynactin subunit 6 n=1 Tax=Elsinoe ampelina TaxID=302913 RepID=A0A6A6G5K7_9PEZI|nr:trimeric LpxA-like protein [Elsinoe ampelina]